MEMTIESVRYGANMSGANLWVLVLAIFTASLGLNVNSTAVIIGAMLISPLMGPIIAIGMGVAIHDFTLVYKALKNFLLAFGLSILTSSIYFFISPLKVPGSELLARTSPTIYDVMIAIVGGLAGIIAGSGKLRQSNVIPGVAIATALMPPLCTVGFGIANLNPTYILGAFYLFFINSVFICLSTYFIVRILNYPVVEDVQSKRAVRIRQTIMALVLIALLPSVYLTFRIVRKYIFEEKVKNFVQQEFSGNRRLVLKSSAEYIGNQQVVNVTVLGAEVDSIEFNELKNRLKIYGLGNANLAIQQGFGDVTRKGSVIGSIHSSIDNNSEAIGKIFSELDSLKKSTAGIEILDTLKMRIGKEVKVWMPDLTIFSLNRESYFDIGSNDLRNAWKAEVSFSKRQPPAQIVKLKTWLSGRLPGDTVFLSVNP
jgi:uncharacterized hydrophobic protein (TIGR00271 family)